QNNELSTQYNVRGGSFDENAVYVNGVEVFRPLLLRSGQQEGLSFVNPEMVERVNFSAGGYSAQYGDKMSSVLDVTYKRPTAFQTTLNLSLLGASAYVAAGDSSYSMMHGIRYKTSQYLLGTLATKGKYQPNFVDYQTYMTWKLGQRKHHNSRWEMSFLGNFSQNSYKFQPEELAQTFGTYATARSLTVAYEGVEKDLFRTAFANLGLIWSANKDLRIGFNLGGFYSNERENYDITAEYILRVKPVSETDDAKDEESDEVLGTGIYHEHARNRLQMGIATASHFGEWKSGMNTLQWGLSAQAEFVKDQLLEWEWRDSMGYSIPTQADAMELYYNLRGTSSLNTVRLQGYVQDTYKWNTDRGMVFLNGGLRMQWWNYNREFLCSPRMSVSYAPKWRHDFVFRVATGLYYQSPFYKELRDTLTDAVGVTRVTLNRNIKAQRSVHVVSGMDYYFRAWGRPFKFTAEAYYKYMDRVVSYTMDNVRIRYSGKNDAVAYTTGLDLKLYGELVPGAESWINFSLMRSRENLLNDNRGWIPGPNEQRYSFSMLFQDYIPKYPQYKLHLRFIWSDGLTYGSPRNLQTRAMLRSTPYRRLDIGASRVIGQKSDKWFKTKHLESIWINLEIFNLIGFNNVNSYFWVTDATGNQWASPNYLTGRMYNVKLTFDFK
ncbi:MAG TPA: TonB-dependent receptor, partial [Bacteroidales bacterium]|nr:TonB-dependent receptor [Bacteroidales bacterium]